MENKINIQFTRAELKTLITLLGMAGNEFSNHGCNDFNILNIGLPITAAHELRSQITDFSKEELEDNKDNPYLYENQGKKTPSGFCRIRLRRKACPRG
jgi:hypothetical protein